MKARHKWGQKDGNWGWRSHRCERCGVTRIQRYAYGIHCVEYMLPNGTYQEGRKAPPCERHELPPVEDVKVLLADDITASVYGSPAE